MPTAEEFEAAAARFDRAAAQLREVPNESMARFSAQPMWGGRLTLATRSTVYRIAGTSMSFAGQLQELAGDCRRRASVVHQAEAAQRRWVLAMGNYAETMRLFDAGFWPSYVAAPHPPLRPPPPPPWAEF